VKTLRRALQEAMINPHHYCVGLLEEKDYKNVKVEEIEKAE